MKTKRILLATLVVMLILTGCSKNKDKEQPVDPEIINPGNQDNDKEPETPVGEDGDKPSTETPGEGSNPDTPNTEGNSGNSGNSGTSNGGDVTVVVPEIETPEDTVVKTVKDKVAIKFTSKEVKDSSKDEKYREVTTKGQEGYREVTTAIYKSGKRVVTSDKVVKPAVNEVITQGTLRVETKVVNESVPFKTEKTLYDENAKAGTTTSTKGVNGKDAVTYVNRYVEGKLVESKEIARETKQAPVNPTVTIGVKPFVEAVVSTKDTETKFDTVEFTSEHLEPEVTILVNEGANGKNVVTKNENFNITFDKVAGKVVKTLLDTTSDTKVVKEPVDKVVVVNGKVTSDEIKSDFVADTGDYKTIPYSVASRIATEGEVKFEKTGKVVLNGVDGKETSSLVTLVVNGKTFTSESRYVQLSPVTEIVEYGNTVYDDRITPRQESIDFATKEVEVYGITEPFTIAGVDGSKTITETKQHKASVTGINADGAPIHGDWSKDFTIDESLTVESNLVNPITEVKVIPGEFNSPGVTTKEISDDRVIKFETKITEDDSIYDTEGYTSVRGVNGVHNFIDFEISIDIDGEAVKVETLKEHSNKITLNPVTEEKTVGMLELRERVETRDDIPYDTTYVDDESLSWDTPSYTEKSGVIGKTEYVVEFTYNTKTDLIQNDKGTVDKSSKVIKHPTTEVIRVPKGAKYVDVDESAIEDWAFSKTTTESDSKPWTTAPEITTQGVDGSRKKVDTVTYAYETPESTVGREVARKHKSYETIEEPTAQVTTIYTGSAPIESTEEVVVKKFNPDGDTVNIDETFVMANGTQKVTTEGVNGTDMVTIETYQFKDGTVDESKIPKETKRVPHKEFVGKVILKGVAIFKVEEHKVPVEFDKTVEVTTDLEKSIFSPKSTTPGSNGLKEAKTTWTVDARTNKIVKPKTTTAWVETEAPSSPKETVGGRVDFTYTVAGKGGSLKATDYDMYNAAVVKGFNAVSNAVNSDVDLKANGVTYGVLNVSNQRKEMDALAKDIATASAIYGDLESVGYTVSGKPGYGNEFSILIHRQRIVTDSPMLGSENGAILSSQHSPGYSNLVEQYYGVSSVKSSDGNLYTVIVHTNKDAKNNPDINKMFPAKDEFGDSVNNYQLYRYNDAWSPGGIIGGVKQYDSFLKGQVLKGLNFASNVEGGPAKTQKAGNGAQKWSYELALSNSASHEPGAGHGYESISDTTFDDGGWPIAQGVILAYHTSYLLTDGVKEVEIGISGRYGSMKTVIRGYGK